MAANNEFLCEEAREDVSRLPALRRGLLSTFQAVSKLEKGDIIGAVSNAQRLVTERAAQIGEDLGSATVRLVEEAAGRVPDVEPNEAVVLGATSQGSMAVQQPLPPPPPPNEQLGGPACPVAGTASLWEEVQRLQDCLHNEREMRKGRVAALGTLNEALRGLRSELTQERRLVDCADSDRLVANGHYDASERSFEELQEEHSTVRFRKGEQEAELRKHLVAEMAAEKAAREAMRDGAWAREGPETDALKFAKLECAEVLAAMDEVRLQERRRAAALQREIDAAQVEGAQLRALLDSSVAPKSFGASIWQLVTDARGGNSRAARVI